MAATDQQMQRYADERVRVRAEQFRAIINAMRDDKVAIEQIYARAVDGGSPWNDARGDGPPQLLDSQDMLVYNAVASIFLKLVDGTASEQEKADFAANLPVFLAACVRSL